jgi:PAS domain-containing protein
MDWLQSILSVFSKVPWDDVRKALLRLVSRQRLLLLSVLMLLVSGAALQYWYWHRSLRYAALIDKTFGSKLEPTPQRYKSLEALLLSTLPANIEAPLLKVPLSKPFVDAYSDFDRAIDKCHPDDTNIGNFFYSRGRGDDAFIGYPPPGFLFFPIHLLRSNFTQQEYDMLTPDRVHTKDTTDLIQRKVKEDGSLALDVATSDCVVASLQEFTHTSITEEPIPLLSTTPIQAYFITKNGITRIVHRWKPKQTYERQFGPDLFFPGRPYFWASFDKLVNDNTDLFRSQLKTATIQTLFSVSHPYMDLGGNGIVVTMCSGVRRPKMSDSVVCVDLPLNDNNIQARIEQTIRAIGGSLVATTCDVSGCDSQGSLTNDLANDIIDKGNLGRLSEIFGNIEVINANLVEHVPLEVSVPVGPREEKTEKASFIVFELDVAGFDRHTGWIGAASGICFGFAIFLLGASLTDTMGREAELREAFDRVSTVMYACPTPYTRLSPDDKVRDANPAFCQLLGLTVTRESLENIHNTTFRSLIAQEDLAKYDDVQARRKKGEPVEPYALTLSSPHGKRIVMIHSAAVPSARHENTQLPETFGIAVEQDT